MVNSYLILSAIELLSMGNLMSTRYIIIVTVFLQSTFFHLDGTAFVVNLLFVISHRLIFLISGSQSKSKFVYSESPRVPSSILIHENFSLTYRLRIIRSSGASKHRQPRQKSSTLNESNLCFHSACQFLFCCGVLLREIPRL